MSAGHLPPRFRRLFAARLAFLAIALTANLLLLAGQLPMDLSLILFASATTLYALTTASAWRCPSCGKYPGNAVMPDFCESCGGALFGHDRQAAAAPTENVAHPERRVVGLLTMRFLYGAALVALFGLGGPMIEGSPALYFGATLAFIGLGAWAEWRWWRCPHCGGYLKRTLWPGRTCLKCGGRLL
ncbi:MAG: hypothetical protein MUE68_08045 [Bacteroidetes bacterium]|jgi:hypothetical protein|nr:hypothetical protein [Bacteroidota bacterium]